MPSDDMLIYACNVGDIGWVRESIKRGANVNVNQDGDIPIFISINHSDTEIVKKLCETDNTIVNRKNDNGETPLEFALKKNSNPEIINILVEYGADFTDKDARKIKNDPKLKPILDKYIEKRRLPRNNKLMKNILNNMQVPVRDETGKDTPIFRYIGSLGEEGSADIAKKFHTSSTSSNHPGGGGFAGGSKQQSKKRKSKRRARKSRNAKR